MLDLVIKDGQIIDGTGSLRRRGDIGIRAGRIVELGKVRESAANTLNADGAIVAPGFVDIHTHYDAQVLWDPTRTIDVARRHIGRGRELRFSVRPLTEEGAPYLMSMLARVEGMPLSSLEVASSWDWRSTADYLPSGGEDRSEHWFHGWSYGDPPRRDGPRGERAGGNREELNAMKELLSEWARRRRARILVERRWKPQRR